jgi:PAS domain S-box-containing protein
VLLVCDEPGDFEQLSAECKTARIRFCRPAEMRDQVIEAYSKSTPDQPLILAVDGRKLDRAAGDHLLSPLVADPRLRWLPIIWLLGPEQQLEFEISPFEAPWLIQYFYPQTQPVALFEARLGCLVREWLSLQNQARLERQLLSATGQIESSQDAIITIGLDFTIRSWNPAAERIYGWKAHEVIGRDLTSVIHTNENLDPDDLLLIAANPPYEDAWKAGKWTGTAIQYTRDGRKLIVDSSVAAVRDAQGYIIEMVGINRNVTAQRQTERELVRSSRELAKVNTFLERIIEQSPIGIGVFDKSGLMIQMNPAYCRIIGIEQADKMVGQYNALENPFAISSGIAEAIKRVLKSEVVSLSPRELDFSDFDQIYGTHKRKVILSRKLFPLFDGGGQVQNVVALVEDITEQRQLTGQLLQSQKMEMIGALAGGLAHDFNNLLTVLFLSLDALKQRLQTEGQAEIPVELVEIEAISRHAADLTSRLLIFTRQKQDQPELISVNDVLKITSSLLRRTVSEDIELRLLPSEGELPPVKASVAQLQQVLMNLVVNARDAIHEKRYNTSQTGASSWHAPDLIEVKTFSRHFNSLPKPGFQPEEDGWQRYTVLPGVTQNLHEEYKVEYTLGWYAGFSVSDNGTGIMPEQLTRIFEPLYTTKESGKGTGLGLAICYAVARDCNGWIEVESRPGVGTSFTLYLPQAEVLPSGALPPAELAPLKTGETGQSRPGLGLNEPPPTVLLAEDEAVLRKVVSRVLRLEGWRVLAVEDGAAALELYQEKEAEIDLVITDTVMPRLGGVGLVNKLLEIDPKVKVILMSGYFENTAELDNVSELLDNQQIRFISKPFKVETLAEMLRAIKN